MKTRRWMPILAGVAVFLAFVGIGAAIIGVSWVREHVAIEPATETSADAAFEEVRERFATKPPLLRMEGRNVSEHNTPAEDAPRASLSTLHVVAWDPDEKRLARVDIPFWLLRLKEGPIRFSTDAAGLNRLGITLTAGQLERYGPGIVLDLTGREERALLWVE